MSLLDDSAPMEPSLTDLLDFVDRTFDSPDDEGSNGSNPSTAVQHRIAAPPAMQPLEDAIEHDGAKKTRGASARASRIYREKKRKELVALRDQVATLETQLATLTHSRSRSRRLERNARAWLGASRVLVEKARLQDAESCNRELKAAIAQHLRVATAMGVALQHAAVFVDLPHAPSSTPVPSFSGPYDCSGTTKTKAMIKHELVGSLGHLYVASIATFARSDRAKLDGTTSRLQHKQDPTSGLPFVEVQHSATLPVAMSKAVQVLRGSMITCFQPAKAGGSQFARDMSFVGEFRDKSRSVKLDILRVSRAYDEEDRYVFTAVSALFDHPETDTLLFQDRLWLFVARSPTNPQSKCIIQTVFQASPARDPAPWTGVSSTDASISAEEVRDLVLQQLGSVYHSAIQAIQKGMVDMPGNETFSGCHRVH